MKKLLPPLVALLLAPQAMSFDPTGDPPKKEWTAQRFSQGIIPRIDFDETSSLDDCLAFLVVGSGRPKDYRVEIDGSALGEAKLLAPCPVKMQLRDIHPIDVLSKLADAIPANLVIEPGKVRLIPRTPVPPKADLKN